MIAVLLSFMKFVVGLVAPMTCLQKCNYSTARVLNTTLVSDGYFTVAEPIDMNHNTKQLY